MITMAWGNLGVGTVAVLVAAIGAAAGPAPADAASAVGERVACVVASVAD